MNKDLEQTELNSSYNSIKTELNDDAISRQAAIDAMSNSLERVFPEHRYIAERSMNKLPSVSTEKTRWIPVKWHNITEDEREQEGYPKEWLTMFDCPMPEDEQEILVTVQGSKREGRYVEKDICYVDDGYSLDSGYDWIDDIVAWCELPQPYKGESEE